jgi:hypothetical protein
VHRRRDDDPHLDAVFEFPNTFPVFGSSELKPSA